MVDTYCHCRLADAEKTFNVRMVQCSKCNVFHHECCVDVPEIVWNEASTTLSLDLCPEFMRDGEGQASFLFHISQQFLPILEGISLEKSKLR